MANPDGMGIYSFYLHFQNVILITFSEFYSIHLFFFFWLQFVYNKLDKVCSGILDRLLNPNHDYDTLNSTILVCILWSMLEAYTTISIHDTSVC